MPSFIELIDITILGTAIGSLLISIIKLKKHQKRKADFKNKKELR